MNKSIYILLFAVLFISNFCTHSKSEIDLKNNDLEKDIINGYLSQTFINRYITEAPTINFVGDLPEPFDSLDFNKVIAYDFGGPDGRAESVISHNSTFTNTVSNQKALNKKQVEKLLSFITNKNTYGYSTAACFQPRWALVFFKNTQITCVIDICLDCNFLSSTLEIPAVSANDLVENDYMLPRHGFSKEGRKSIKYLAKELEMQYGNYNDEEDIYE